VLYAYPVRKAAPRECFCGGLPFRARLHAAAHPSAHFRAEDRDLVMRIATLARNASRGASEDDIRRW